MVYAYERESPTQGLTSPTGGLKQKGQDHASFKIFLSESRRLHVIFRMKNRNNLLETVYF